MINIQDIIPFMTDLTEQWKKGELLEGFYYVKCDWSDEVEIRYVHNGVDDWKEIIAPVPSYEEYLSLTYAKEEDEGIIAEYEAENTKLKELLKRARGLMNCTKDWACTEATEEMITKINQALGEDK